MTVRSAAGWTAVTSGALLIAAIGVLGLTGATAVAPSGVVGPAMMGPGVMGPGMMTGYGGGMGMMHGWGRPTGTTTTRPGVTQVSVRALNFGFEPSSIALPKDADVDLTLTNPTANIHDITVPALGIQLVAPAGTTRTLALSGLPAGRYVGYCSVPGHAEAGMRLTVVVE